jgi:hypothetical protein
MEKFPDDFNRVSCFKKLTENQKTLMNESRKTFYDSIIKSIDDCAKNINLKFPEKLWPEHRVLITCELLEKFGEVTVYAKNGKATITKITTDKADIPSNIESLKLDF